MGLGRGGVFFEGVTSMKCTVVRKAMDGIGGGDKKIIDMQEKEGWGKY